MATVTVRTRGRPAIVLRSAGGPQIATATVPGPQGAQGIQGERGQQGLPGDYGYVRYGEMLGATPRPIAAMTESAFVVQAPQTINDTLKPPFSGFAFLGLDNVLRARKAGDGYAVSVRFSVVPTLFGGWVRVSINVAGNVSGLTGPTASRTIPLEGAAGDLTRVDEVFSVYPQTGFIANGATITLYSSVPIAVSNDVLFVEPRVAAP